MRAYHEELFGPVAVVHRAENDDQALALANDPPYGLGGSVFSGDEQRARWVAAERVIPPNGSSGRDSAGWLM